jgi:hypothetical protein
LYERFYIERGLFREMEILLESSKALVVGENTQNTVMGG